MSQKVNESFNRKYKILAKIGEGSYSEVLKCKNRDNGNIYACKKLKHIYRSWNQVNDIPEIVTLRKLVRHPNILQMTEIHFDPNVGTVSLVFELMDMNLYELIKDRKRLLQESRVKIMMFQLVRALRHLHKHGVFHRDIKPENILLRNDQLKLGDLGSVRGLYSRPPYTEYISTRWYRSPECLLTSGFYSYKMDIWAAGCVFFEILTLRPLFPGASELDQINRIHNVIGAPSQRVLQKFTRSMEERDRLHLHHSSPSKQKRLEMIKRVLSDVKNKSYTDTEGKSRSFEWAFPSNESTGLDRLVPSHVTVEARDMLKLMLSYDPDLRPTCHRILQNSYFQELREQLLKKQETLTGVSNKEPIITIVGIDASGKSPKESNIDLGHLGDSKKKRSRVKEDKKDVEEKKPKSQIKPVIEIIKEEKVIIVVKDKEKIDKVQGQLSLKTSNSNRNNDNNDENNPPALESKSKCTIKEEKEKLPTKESNQNQQHNILNSKKESLESSQENEAILPEKDKKTTKVIVETISIQEQKPPPAVDDVSNLLEAIKKSTSTNNSKDKLKSNANALKEKKGSFKIEIKPSPFADLTDFNRAFVSKKNFTSGGAKKINATRRSVQLEDINPSDLTNNNTATSKLASTIATITSSTIKPKGMIELSTNTSSIDKKVYLQSHFISASSSRVSNKHHEFKKLIDQLGPPSNRKNDSNNNNSNSNKQPLSTRSQLNKQSSNNVNNNEEDKIHKSKLSFREGYGTSSKTLGKPNQQQQQEKNNQSIASNGKHLSTTTSEQNRHSIILDPKRHPFGSLQFSNSNSSQLSSRKLPVEKDGFFLLKQRLLQHHRRQEEINKAKLSQMDSFKKYSFDAIKKAAENAASVVDKNRIPLVSTTNKMTISSTNREIGGEKKVITSNVNINSSRISNRPHNRNDKQHLIDKGILSSRHYNPKRAQQYLQSKNIQSHSFTSSISGGGRSLAHAKRLSPASIAAQKLGNSLAISKTNEVLLEERRIAAANKRKELLSNSLGPKPLIGQLKRQKIAAGKNIVELSETIGKLLEKADAREREREHEREREREHAKQREKNGSFATHQSNSYTNKNKSQSYTRNHIVSELISSPRDDHVFCSSDDDVIKSYREKFGSLISERAFRRKAEILGYQELHNKNNAADDDPNNKSYRSPFKPPPRRVGKKNSKETNDGNKLNDAERIEIDNIKRNRMLSRLSDAKSSFENKQSKRV